MRTLTIAICLVAVVCVAAESAPGKEEHAYFALADHVGVIREAEFYGHLLSDFDPITPYNIVIPAAPVDLTSPTERCKNAKGEAESMLFGLVSSLDKILGVLPIGDYIRNFIDKTAHDITRMLHEGWHSFNLVGVRTALGTLHFLLNGIAAMPIPLLADIFKIMSDAVKAVLELLSGELGCSFDRKEVIEEAMAPAQCFELADFYRGAVANTLENPPALTEVSAEIKRLVEESATILDVMSKSSIAATNEDILTIRPIFGTAELLQYRDELLQLSESEEIQKYAAGALSVIISSSNALKACISIAANVAKPTEGSSEVNKEIEQIEDEK
ncbi:hypothetical protein BG006_004592 [Podila minutissima]|uniref:Uncharacterized protein n=1 Tax=Podila minutissima TaxID=64525 RepID=A0A9P5SNN0_9FUNG|nr:hypothetical protein BG006_004592 [Podila minutissima]